MPEWRFPHGVWAWLDAALRAPYSTRLPTGRHETGKGSWANQVMSALRIWNPIRETVVVERAPVAHSHRERAVGLLGKRTATDGEGLLLKGTRAIHTFGMHFPIDVIYLDPANRVLCTISALPPNRFGPLHWGVQSVLELSTGAIARSRTQVGDFLRMDELDE